MFFTNPSKIPTKRCAYAIEHGAYVGEFFVFIERDIDTYYFLSLPKMEVREVPIKEFQPAITDKIISFVEKIPFGTYKVCLAQFKKVKHEQKSNNRHTKPSVPRLPHQKTGG